MSLRSTGNDSRSGDRPSCKRGCSKEYKSVNKLNRRRIRIEPWIKIINSFRYRYSYTTILSKFNANTYSDQAILRIRLTMRTHKKLFSIFFYNATYNYRAIVTRSLEQSDLKMALKIQLFQNHTRSQKKHYSSKCQMSNNFANSSQHP